MRLYMLTLCLFCWCANGSPRFPVTKSGKSRSLPLVDALIESLESMPWKPRDGACLRATLDMLEGVNNKTFWATWVWDSIQLPSGSMYGSQAHLGNYEQCLGAPWASERRHPGLRLQYCLAVLRSPAAVAYHQIGTLHHAHQYYGGKHFVTVLPRQMPIHSSHLFNYHYIGVCLPSVCSPSSVAKISRHLLRLTHLPPGDLSVDPRDCTAAGEPPDYPTGFYVFWAVVLILAATTIVATLFNSYNNGDGGDKNTTFLAATLRCFCLKRNYRRLVCARRGEMRALRGLRTLSAALIVLLHEDFYTMISLVINSLDINKFLTSRAGLTALHLEIIVDTFFAMSGLLLLRGLLAGRQKNLLHTLAKRYIRLIGPFALCVAYQALVAQHMGDGPVWGRAARPETENCRTYWWKSLLMANTDVDTLCCLVTWYIACDFQLATLATFLFYSYKKNSALGAGATAAILTGLTAQLGLMVYWDRLDILPFNIKLLTSQRTPASLNGVYLSSGARAAPYFVGAVAGFLVAAYEPAHYRNTINKGWSVALVTASSLVAAAMLAVGAIFASRPYDALETAVVVATNRAVWAAMVCALVAVCEYGSLSTLPSLLGWHGFVPLSKLSYCLYLLHPILLQYQKFSTRSPATYSKLNLVLNACGVLAAAGALALPLHLAVEAPLLSLSDEMFAADCKQLGMIFPKKPLKCAAISGGVSLFGLLFGWVLFPALLKHMLKKEMALSRKTELRGMWEVIPFPFDFKVYFFNYTNPEEIQKGELPMVKEIGPYYFELWKVKVDLEDNDKNDTVSFRRKDRYYFKPELSGPGLTGEEIIVMPHPLILSTLNAMTRINAAMVPLVVKGIKGIFENPSDVFIRVKPLDLLFRGVLINCARKDFAPKAVCTAYRKEGIQVFQVEPNNQIRFSFFGRRNSTGDPTLFTVKRGVRNVAEVGTLLAMDGKTEMTVWRGACNNYSGTEGTVFPPFLTPQERIVAFEEGVCRPFKPWFVRKTKYRGIKTYRYTVDIGDFANDPEMNCYCDAPDQCSPKGLMDLMNCIQAPLYLSQPHYLGCDPILLKNVKGLNPNEEEHGMMFDFEPISGTPLNVRKRVQFSIQLMKSDKYDLCKNLPDTVAPLFWFEEGVSLNKTYIRILNMQLFIPKRVVSVFSWLLLLLGAAAAGACLMLHLRGASEDNKVTTVKPQEDEKGVSVIGQQQDPTKVDM